MRARPPELIERFLNEARPSLRWAVKLALYTGQRRSDLVKVKWSQFWRDDKGRYWIDVCQQKTGAALSIPCHKELRMELESMPRVADTILIGDRGGPLEADSLSAAVRKQLRAMGVKGYVIHGLRKNAAVELINAGPASDGNHRPWDCGHGCPLFEEARPTRTRQRGDGEVGAKWQT